MRIAVVSSPRCGGMWLRRLLVAAHDLEERSSFTPDEVDWHGLPERCVLHIHWHRDEALLALLARHRFATVTVARHPVDVLVSILHFAQHEPATSRWLDGEGGDESSLLGTDPTSAAFLRYATGPRARALLSVTPEWWPHAGTRLRYEDLVADPAGEIERMSRELGFSPLVPPAEAAAAVRFADLQREAVNQHFWQGRPGLGRELVPAAAARTILSAHPAMAAFGYDAGATDVSAAEARALWRTL